MGERPPFASSCQNPATGLFLDFCEEHLRQLGCLTSSGSVDGWAHPAAFLAVVEGRQDQHVGPQLPRQIGPHLCQSLLLLGALDLEQGRGSSPECLYGCQQ